VAIEIAIEEGWLDCARRIVTSGVKNESGEAAKKAKK
jgi:hypothetical protein